MTSILESEIVKLPMDKLLPRSFRSYKGFTLIELMVAITIIAILATIGMTLFSDVQKNGRDSRRKGDVEAISKALEAGYNAQLGTYPTALTAAMFSNSVVPTDPKTNANYATSALSPAASTFYVCATLEKPTGNFNDAIASTQPASPNTGTHFCRKHQQ